MDMGQVIALIKTFTKSLKSEIDNVDEKYSDALNMVGVASRNLNKTEYATRTDGGVTFTLNDDYSVSLSGVSTGGAYFLSSNKNKRFLLPAGTYTLSTHAGTNKIYAYISFYADQTTTTSARVAAYAKGTGNYVTFVTDTDYYVAVNICVESSGIDTTGMRLYPMVEAGSSVSDYESPYSTSRYESERLAEIESDIEELQDKTVLSYEMRVENIRKSGQGPADIPVGLSLYAAKCIYKEGEVPDYTGYLYADIPNRKFYYATTANEQPSYLFDWNTSIVNGDGCDGYCATITADGDIIFLKYCQRINPIIYPHTDYSSPYVVDFGNDRKPFGWLVGSSIVQFEDGSFVFGDYAYHSENDETNDVRRIIWKVEKPYAKANWTQAHSFKHVYFDHYQSVEPDNEIGHIHAIMYDQYSDDLFCTTGDIDRHCRMWISDDHGDTWSAVPGAVGTTENVITSGEGQKWRMTNAVFTSDGIYWATDAQKPYHILWKCTRNQNGHIDFSTLTEVCNVEIFGTASDKSQRTYITALLREPYGLLLLDRGEPRDDILQPTFYDLKKNELVIIGQFERATTDAGTLEADSRLGIPMQCTTVYQPQDTDGIITGGGKTIRPNNTGMFNNSRDYYVGTMKIGVFKN